jgi:hypothetical protein
MQTISLLITLTTLAASPEEVNASEPMVLRCWGWGNSGQKHLHTMCISMKASYIVPSPEEVDAGEPMMLAA